MEENNTDMHCFTSQESSCSVQVAGELEGRQGETQVKLFVLQLNRNAAIHVSSRAEAGRVCEVLDYVYRRTPGKLWDMLGLLLQARFYWPVWSRYRRGLLKEGAVLRRAEPRLRERRLVLNERGNVRSEDYSHQAALYSASRLRPQSEETGNPFFNRVRMFEGDELDLSELFDVVAQIPARTISKYLAVTWDSNQLERLPSEEIVEYDLRELLRCGLVTHAKNAPLDVLLRRMNASALYAPIKERQIKLPKRGIQAYRQFYAENMDEEYEAALRASSCLEGQFVYIPPANWSWEQLQDFRTCYVEMIHTLINWLSGEPVRALEQKYYIQMV